jgi:hypothetical protein
VEFKILEIDQQYMLHVVHVAGTQLVGQGLDGLSRGNFEDLFLEVLLEIQEERPDLIPESVDISDHGLSCSWRISSTSAAVALGLEDSDIDFMNRWCTVENARGRRPVFRAMRDHYADVRLTSLDVLFFATPPPCSASTHIGGCLVSVTGKDHEIEME